MSIADQLRTYRNGVHGPFFLEAADRLEELESENENLHLENDTLFLRLENGMPWADLFRDGWRIVGMNHYNLSGKPHLFCSMSKGQRCIVAEAENEALVFQKLAELAKQPESV